jgi:hypothetical protein
MKFDNTFKFSCSLFKVENQTVITMNHPSVIGAAVELLTEL